MTHICWSCGGDVPDTSDMPTFCTYQCRDDYWGAQHDPVTDTEMTGSRAVINGVIDNVPSDRTWTWAEGAR